MSEIEINKESQDQESEESTFNIHNVFNKRPDVEVAQVNQAPKKKDPEKKPEQVKKVSEPIDLDEDEDEDEDEPKDSKQKPEVKKDTSDSIDYKSEYEKLQKTVKDTQRSFHEDRRKLAAYKKAVEKFKEDGFLDEDDANTLLDHTKFESTDEDVHPLIKASNIWEKEIFNMKKYSQNADDIDKNVEAFQHLYQASSAREQEEILSELSKYDDDEIEFTKQMLEMGRQYNDEIYEDIRESGSIRNLKSKYSEKETELQNRIDKLERKIYKLKSKYEDYNEEPANLRLPTGSSHKELPKNVTFDPKSIFERQYQRG